MVRPWSEDLEDHRQPLKSVPIWVKFHDVPKQLWTKKGLSLIASRLGKPHCWDDATQRKTRLDFGKVCIEVKVYAQYPTSLKFKLKVGKIAIVKVEYTWKPPSCTFCDRFGYSLAKCPNKPATTWRPVTTQRETATATDPTTALVTRAVAASETSTVS
ncbi:hypothetical protein IFM89_001055 [Coptis chinensis]|uniref:DUF4283 domain-containing protein n=1 Tax=Coptis chinensis TaxID=261450 RepID=A0A835LHC1_9MAGN|nr:hypothetical protein IFM89_001055 [Coptis chinensis]